MSPANSLPATIRIARRGARGDVRPPDENTLCDAELGPFAPPVERGSRTRRPLVEWASRDCGESLTNVPIRAKLEMRAIRHPDQWNSPGLIAYCGQQRHHIVEHQVQPMRAPVDRQGGNLAQRGERHGV